MNIEINGRSEIQINSTSFAEFGELIRKKVFKKEILSRRREGFVYAITDGRLVKIGKATDVEKRLSELQIGSATPLSVLAQGAFKDAATAEAEYHICYSNYRVRGEWFDFPNHVLKKLLKRISNSIFPEDGGAIKWDGAISACPACGDRAYEAGWCFGCGKRLAKKTFVDGDWRLTETGYSQGFWR